ncbi:MAG: metal-dependent hydrolase, partial [Flammeovirgaceae bacterium]
FLAAFLAAFYRFIKSKPLTVFIVCFLSCFSHALLDALTNGGFGVALYWPFSHERIFSDFRPIQVSPIGVGQFFTEKGLKVIASELQWVILPSVFVGSVGYFIRKAYEKKEQKS